MRFATFGTTLLAGLLVAAPVQAATVSHTESNDRTIYTAEPGEENRLVIDDLGTPGSDNVFTDAPGIEIDFSAPCYRAGSDPPNVVRCPNSYSTDVLLGDGDDTASAGDVDFGYPFLKGEAGDDRLVGSTGRSSTAMAGGPGRDEYVDGPRGFDHVTYFDRPAPVVASLDGVANDPDGENVPSNIDSLGGGDGDDVLSGSPEFDYLHGAGGKDLVRGLGGPDEITGGDGDDRLEGGDGNDVFNRAEKGADDVSGGAGFDRFELARSSFVSPSPTDKDPFDMTVSLDDVANDGDPGEGDNVHTDIEDLASDFYVGHHSRVSLTGDAGFNVLTGGRRNDRLEGGPGSDRLVAREGDDTIAARDGFADRVECGPGTDTAVVDPQDQLADCESVDRAPVDAGSASTAPPSDDRPPTVAFATPGEGALLTGATTVRVDARDDRGVSRVLLMDDDRVVATDTTAPYELAYAPKGDDVGRATLVAIAVDAAEQTATAVRPVRVDRFLPGVTATVSPARDRRAPYRYRLAGALTLPDGVTPAQACTEGEVSVQVKRGSRTLSTRRARVDRRCAFASTVTFRDRRRLGSGRLRATVRFLGNDVLRPRTAPSTALRAG